MNIKELVRSFSDMLFPRRCPVCGKVLNFREKFLCLDCLSAMPLTHFHRRKMNDVEQLFAGKVPVERASGIFFYSKDSGYAQILQDIKYHNMPQMARFIASEFSKELVDDGFFEGIDYIVPIPLHHLKFAQRGYNQSEYVAKGFSDSTGIPVIKAIRAVREHSSQTNKGAYERYLNTRNVFGVTPGQEKMLEGKHILIVDDVITTGATIESAATVLLSVPGVRCSVLTLAVARLD